MKFVIPRTRTLRTTPTMIWSTRYTMAKAASTIDNNAAPIIAATRPRYRLCVSVPTTAARKAPVNNCPSIAILTTPTRSDMIPPIAPSARGTARTTALPRMKAKGRLLPAASHASRATTAASPNISVNHIGVFVRRNASAKEIPATATRTTPRTIPTRLDATRKSGSLITSSSLDH